MPEAPGLLLVDTSLASATRSGGPLIRREACLSATTQMSVPIVHCIAGLCLGMSGLEIARSMVSAARPKLESHVVRCGACSESSGKVGKVCVLGGLGCCAAEVGRSR